jgi:hypothetical protein
MSKADAYDYLQGVVVRVPMSNSAGAGTILLKADMGGIMGESRGKLYDNQCDCPALSIYCLLQVS